MLYYPFECENCGDERLFIDRETINELIDRGYHQCGLCDHRTEIDPGLCYEDQKPEPIDYYHDDSDYRGYDNQDTPAVKDMEVLNEDLEDVEDWQRFILQEWGESDDLTRDDKYGYEDALAQLKSHQFGWVKFGLWAFQFKVKRFYKYHHKTWKQFCENVLHRNRYYVDKLIKAVRVMKDLICAGFEVLPQNEYQCRFLTKFWGEELTENWAMIVDAVPPHLITGDLLKAQFSVREEKEEKWIKVNSQVWEEFQWKARQKGLNPNHVIEDILHEWGDEDYEPNTDDLADDEVEEVPTEKLEAWQDDLQALIEEKDRTDNWFTQLIFWSFAYANST